MFYTTYLANKIVDWLHRAQAYTPATTGFSVGLLTSTKGPRGNSTVYALNDTISLTANDSKTHLYKCTTAGTSAAAQSTLYPGVASEVITDGTAVFTEQTAALRAGIGGAVVEAAWTNYARSNTAASLANWAGTQSAGSTAASSGTGIPTTSNNGTLTFGTTPGSGPSYVWASATFDAASAGNMLEIDPLTTVKTVNSGDAAPTFAAGALVLSIDN
ncbi:MAG: hypothetical protein Q7U28_08195 [Aquabacterium sp.]|nr:hypothetical protein [Aquabacterium sp.]